MGADEPPHAVAHQEHRSPWIPVINVGAECLHRFEILGESFQVYTHTGRRSVPDVIGARHGHAALIKARSNMLVASGMLGKTMREQHAGLGIVGGPVSILDTAGEALHEVSAP